MIIWGSIIQLKGDRSKVKNQCRRCECDQEWKKGEGCWNLYLTFENLKWKATKSRVASLKAYYDPFCKQETICSLEIKKLVKMICDEREFTCTIFPRIKCYSITPSQSKVNGYFFWLLPIYLYRSYVIVLWFH